ncbi:MAG: alkaline phosphatase [Sutterellaceae bacterium]|nr:alkaline phosphatase [Burkholderiaceae bacterium]MDW8429032.1 alkaline phosphatase [Sutterellaceae bacterium]
MVARKRSLSLLIAAASVAAIGALAVSHHVGAHDDHDTWHPDGGRQRGSRFLSTGSVIFFHPDGTGLNHWHAARLYFVGPDGRLNWDRLPYMAVYRGHMANVLTGTSNGGATTHAFGYKVDGLGSFGKDGDGNLGLDREIRSLSGYPGSLMREAANAGIPVGIVNDGHIAEPGTGAFLAEVGNRDNWQEITRQIIQGRPGKNDVTPWVIMGGGEADTLPAGATLTHRNVNQERGAPLNSRLSLRTDNLNLQAEWNAKGSGDLSNDPLRFDDYVVVRTRAEFERLKAALAANKRYAPRVLGLFAFQDIFNDRNEQDLINRGFVRPEMAVGETGPAPKKQSRIVLWGDYDPAQPGYNPPSFAEMVEVAIEILDRAADQQRHPAQRRFFLVAEQEANDNFGNNDNAVGMLHAMRDTDNAIGVALRYLRRNPRTLILTAADSDAGGMQVLAPNKAGVTPPTNVLAPGQAPDIAGTVSANPSAASATGLPSAAAVNNFLDGVEGRQSPLFVSEPDQFGQRMQFGIAWPGTPDFAGGILTRAIGLNAELLLSTFSQRFDNIDVYRMMYLTLFGRLLDYPSGQRAPSR